MALARRCLLLALLGTVLPALAAPLSEADVRAQAEQFVARQYAAPGSRVEVKSEALDPRLRIADCTAPLAASLPGGLRMTPRLSVLVRCPTADGWTLRVPVELHVFRPVLVASRPLVRGDGIVAADVHPEQRDVTRDDECVAGEVLRACVHAPRPACGALERGGQCRHRCVLGAEGIVVAMRRHEDAETIVDDARRFARRGLFIAVRARLVTALVDAAPIVVGAALAAPAVDVRGRGRALRVGVEAAGDDRARDRGAEDGEGADGHGVSGSAGGGPATGAVDPREVRVTDRPRVRGSRRASRTGPRRSRDR